MHLASSEGSWATLSNVAYATVYLKTRPNTRPKPVADGWAGARTRVFTLSDRFQLERDNSSVTDGLTDRRTDGPTDRRTDRQTGLQRCEGASKKRLRNKVIENDYEGKCVFS